MATIKFDERVKIFVREFIIDFNGTRAAKAAGYTGDEKTLAVQASRMLKDERVRKELKKAISERIKRTEVTADRVVHELARIGFSDITEVVEWDEHPDTGEPRSRLIASKNLRRKTRRALRKAKFKPGQYGTSAEFELHDKVKALELLGRHTGVFVEKGDPDADSNEERVVVHLPDNGRGGNEDN